MNKRILDVVRNGKKFETENFTLYLKDNCHFLKIGFQITHHYGASVKRNRIKRIFRSLIRKTFKTGDVVVRINSSCDGLTEEKIWKDWTTIERKVF
ncbi:MAG: ribonuclease P protein component [Candidatus Omnitrophica bacterium]|nr:ribonuclease P protein component [Candidatus Omnitrophota bacterium]MCM8788467.1 ribonuclease P protein component [Candidatus Omnitrophota bacterium]